MAATQCLRERKKAQQTNTKQCCSNTPFSWKVQELHGGGRHQEITGLTGIANYKLFVSRHVANCFSGSRFLHQKQKFSE
jgi:hypothetical protein